MSAGAGFDRLRKEELFARLAVGHAARIVVVTPNRRLAAALTRDFDAYQVARGPNRWEAPDILPFAAFVERIYDDALYSELTRRLPLLLQPAQEQALWETAIRESDSGRSLLAVSGAASLAREAWRTAHEWRLAPRLKHYPANDDARAFADWSARYERATARLRYIERARLPDVVTPYLAHAALRKPAVLVACGFDLLTPQQREFFGALEKAGAALFEYGHDIEEARERAPRRVAFVSAEEEFRAAARWSRARLEANPRARIGVVVPDLQQSRDQVRRIFVRTLAPASCMLGPLEHPLPFDLSLGEPLTAYPIVAAGLLIFDIARGEVDFSAASRLLRSPFLGGAEAEMPQRARLDAELRAIAGARIDLDRLRRAIARLMGQDHPRGIPACPVLSRRLAEMSAFAAEHLTGARRASEWAHAFSALLDCAGFPGERSLDSAEYQALKKLHEAIAGFAALDAVAGRMRFEDARSRLARIAADTLFQPEAPEVPILVLGVLESAGMAFDHLWVTGLSDEVWPIPARPNPFLPIALQRAAGVPEASAASSLELDRRITQGWLAAAGEVILSHPLREDDRELLASPLISDVRQAPFDELKLPAYDTLRDVIRRARREERIADARAPALARVEPDTRAIPVSGGAGVFGAQAACPFRAFASHRLAARGMDEPSPGPDAAERGTLLHATLAAVWGELKSKARLDALPGDELNALLTRSAEQALSRLRRRRPDAMTGKFAELEKARLTKLARDWLAIEKKRPAFEALAVEEKRVLNFGGIEINARLDRIDKLSDGGHTVIDYKTGAASTGGWWGERPDEPQLPLYAAGASEEIAALAFARVKAGDMAFKGVSRDPEQLPGVKTLAGQRALAAKKYDSWPALLAAWKKELDALGREFASGEARVSPKRGEQTCRHCELKPLCRINERAPYATDGETIPRAESE